jgi:hypothetical protein
MAKINIALVACTLLLALIVLPGVAAANPFIKQSYTVAIPGYNATATATPAPEPVPQDNSLLGILVAVLVGLLALTIWLLK